MQEQELTKTQSNQLKFEQESEKGEYLELPPRNSEDKGHIDIRGEELFELCRSLNLLILNGRKTGDPWGKICLCV